MEQFVLSCILSYYEVVNCRHFRQYSFWNTKMDICSNWRICSSIYVGLTEIIKKNLKFLRAESRGLSTQILIDRYVDRFLLINSVNIVRVVKKN